jgi:hypothetical protein
MRKLLLFGCLLSLLVACDRETFCDERWAEVNVQVNGPRLDQYFTIRNATGDTLRELMPEQSEGYYWVLDDRFQSLLEGREETFRFLGFISDSLVVEAPFKIGADKCHIFKVSGPEVIDL